ncbi:MAG: hypothetical protein ACK5VW_05805, partial [Holosporales bacterium]
KIQSMTSPDFLRKVNVAGEDYTFISFTDGSHSADLMILMPDQTVKTLNLGPITAVLSADEFPFMKPQQVLVVSSTGGSGQHHVYGLVLDLDEKSEPVMRIPLHGYLTPAGLVPEHLESIGGTAAFSYAMTKIEKQQGQLRIQGILQLKTEGFSAREVQDILKAHDLPAVEMPYEINLKNQNTTEISCAAGCKPWLDAVLANLSN